MPMSDGIIGATVGEWCKATQMVDDQGKAWAKDVKQDGQEYVITLRVKGTDFGFWCAANCGFPYQRKPAGCQS